MKTMKAMLVLFVFGGLCGCKTTPVLDYPQPGYDKSGVQVIDSYSVPGTLEDFVKLRNESSNSDISFTVHVHDHQAGRWLVLGTGILKFRGDTDTIDTGIDDLKNYRYFAVESLNDKNYKLDFYKRHNDLYITILDS